MRKFLLVPGAAVLAAVSVAGGFWAGAGKPDLPAFLALGRVALLDEPAGVEVALGGPPAPGERKILYYRNPMGLPDISYEPKKDSMGMDYLPVYADEANDAGSVTVSPARIQTLGVRTEPVVRRPMVRTIRSVATIEPDERRMAMVTPRVEGWVERLHVNETGRDVAQGEPLMDVYSPELQRAQANYLLAITGDRPEDLDGGRLRLISLGLSEAQVERLRISGRIQRTITIPAPASGTVLEKAALEGMMFRPGDPLFTIADLSVVTVMIDVFEQDISVLREGADATIAVTAYPGEAFKGRVDRIYPALDSETRTVRVRITLDNQQGRLRGGMLATAEITAILGGDAVAVPDSAVIDSGRRKLVFVETGPGSFRPTEIRTGRRSEGYIEVLTGLAGGERVVVGANFLIDAESNIKAALAAFSAGSAPEARP
ncbi:efflux RND transporter periplasmic adaptor subunit [Oleomonas cavernae]|uniref:Efflux RND transporter periplasmic adaptor subunit n=1 Tax=Oleomonas cavernae TaxID=2320859 RepID=A0A418WEB8_9PROT|nr:efflux RND transporter periplasmic adaptor subunit [Oleomonas cavernae]RJF88363.1 efflux RND transporter periplasmic adaptor subunit [Oleomonas cavernae]